MVNAAMPASHSNESSTVADTDLVFQHDAITNTNSTRQRKISSDYDTQFDPPAVKVGYGGFEEHDAFSQVDSLQSSSAHTITEPIQAFQPCL